ncbi:MAG: hypothetical protein ACYDA9_07865 [Terriglobia bacterium]
MAAGTIGAGPYFWTGGHPATRITKLHIINTFVMQFINQLIPSPEALAGNAVVTKAMKDGATRKQSAGTRRQDAPCPPKKGTRAKTLPGKILNAKGKRR